jgi:hypothetical protein
MYWLSWQYQPMTRTPAATSRIHESLDTALARKRLVICYDPSAEGLPNSRPANPPRPRSYGWSATNSP